VEIVIDTEGRSCSVTQSRPTEVIHFLEAVVGYSRTAYLTRSLTGIQFLGDKALLRPVRHLKDLVNALEHPCMQVRFPDLPFI